MNRLLVDCASPKPSVMRLLLCAVGAYGRHRGRSGVQQPDGLVQSRVAAFEHVFDLFLTCRSFPMSLSFYSYFYMVYIGSMV